MLPGMGGGMDPRQMSQMMKKLGINVEELDNVQEIIIKTPDKDYVFDDASVSIMRAQGTETWQISGTPQIKTHEVQLKISDDDIAMVVDQTGCTPEQARGALEDAGGDLAEAIVGLSSD